MEGAEHYREAEILLSGATPDGGRGHRVVTAEDIARAQVHATLALAAATAARMVHKMCGDSTRITEWGRVINWDTAPRPLCNGAQFDERGGVERCYGEPGHQGGHQFYSEPPF